MLFKHNSALALLLLYISSALCDDLTFSVWRRKDMSSAPSLIQTKVQPGPCLNFPAGSEGRGAYAIPGSLRAASVCMWETSAATDCDPAHSLQSVKVDLQAKAVQQSFLFPEGVKSARLICNPNERTELQDLAGLSDEDLALYKAYIELCALS